MQSATAQGLMQRATVQIRTKWMLVVTGCSLLCFADACWCVDGDGCVIVADGWALANNLRGQLVGRMREDIDASASAFDQHWLSCVFLDDDTALEV